MLSQRQNDILSILKIKGSVSVYELSKTLYVAEMTIRRDLIEMEKGGFLRRYRGGAVLFNSPGDMPISERLLLYKEEKDSQAGKNTIEFDVKNLSSGMYFYTMTFKGQKLVKKMTIE